MSHTVCPCQGICRGSPTIPDDLSTDFDKNKNPPAALTTMTLVDKAVELRNELASRNPENGALASCSGDPCLPLQWEGLQCEPISDKSFIIVSMGLVRSLAHRTPKLAVAVPRHSYRYSRRRGNEDGVGTCHNKLNDHPLADSSGGGPREDLGGKVVDDGEGRGRRWGGGGDDGRDLSIWERDGAPGVDGGSAVKVGRTTMGVERRWVVWRGCGSKGHSVRDFGREF
ncbi:hypothetical protein Sjap_011064 [Stephania japonica]|uniref:Uncharacterized protein n=1 Tax=Stephania japonica TaxID=461633 RepID=A0AAP0JCT5_9MAGN